MRIRIVRPRYQRLPFIFEVIWGKGAGYKGGWTAYFALGRLGDSGYRRPRGPLAVGITRNWNALPLFPYGSVVAR